jgi:phage terminase large subunit GpA-like protein
MKRDPIVKYEFGINTTYPWFFWVHCCECGKEFRREKLWTTLTGPFYNGGGTWRYLCKHCVPTIQEAHKYFIDDRWLKRVMGNPPTCRPAPPKGQGVRNKP